MSWISVPWNDFSPCIPSVSDSLCISTPNLVGVGRIRAASSRTGELSIHLKQQDIQISRRKKGGGSREDDQIKMPISKAQKTIPELGFLNPGTLLSCPLPLSHQQAGGLTASSLTGRCRLRCYVGSSFTTAGPSNTVYSVPFSGSADFSPPCFLGLGRGPAT